MKFDSDIHGPQRSNFGDSITFPDSLRQNEFGGLEGNVSITIGLIAMTFDSGMFLPGWIVITLLHSLFMERHPHVKNVICPVH